MAGSIDIVVVPREQFGKTVQSLESIYANTRIPFRLIYVDGNSPKPVRRYLERQARLRGFTLLSSWRYLSANQARNMGLRHCTARYVAFLDNDVVVLPGWLEKLVACAQETGAGIVGPLYYFGDPSRHCIHNAGAELIVREHASRRTLHELQRCANRDARTVRLDRQPVDLVEFHCLVASKDVLDAVPFDERLLSWLDHTDFCLRAKAAGFKIYSEPDAAVAYLAPPPLALSDVPYFFMRWSNAWLDPSIRHFAVKHGFALNDDDMHSHYRYRDAHRLLLIGVFRRIIRRLLGARACAAIDYAMNRYVFDGFVERLVVARYA